MIASLLTASHGYVRVIAKSARRPTSAFRSVVQPGRLTNLEFTMVPNRQLQFLRAGHVLLDPLAADARLEKAALLLAVVELVDRCRPAGAREGPLFALCMDYIKVLSCAPPGEEVSLFYAFELSLLALQGVAPTLASCSSCGNVHPVEGGSRQWFSPASGGLVCDRCRVDTGTADARNLTSEVLDVLLDLEMKSDGGLQTRPLESHVARQVGILLHRFLSFHLPGYQLPSALELLRIPPDFPSGGKVQVEEWE